MKNLIKSTAYLTISNVLTRILSMLFFVILARLLSIGEYGLFRYLLTISSMYAIIFTGIPTALVKYISGRKRDISEYISGTIIIMFVLFIIASSILLVQLNALFLILLLFAVLVDAFYIGYIRGLLNYTKLIGFKLVENLIQLIILIIAYVLYKQIDFNWAIIFYAFSGIISLIIFEYFKYELKFKFKINRTKIKQLIKYSIPVTLGSVGWILMFGINAIFINYFYNSEQVAFFSVGETIVQIFSFLPAAIATIMLPKVASLKDKSKILKPLKLAIIGSLILSLIMLIVLIFFKKEIITIIFTDKYLPTLAVIIPLSIGQIFIVLHQIYASLFQGLGKPGIPSITISIAAFLNIIGSYFLTKQYGIVGAATSNAITSAIALIIIIIIFKKKWKTLSKQ